LDEAKKKFEQRVMVWKVMQEMFEGWDGLADYLEMPSAEIKQYAMNDIVAYGTDLGLKWSPQKRNI
jgi:hypothetical protein